MSGLGVDACRNDLFYAMPRSERVAKARALLKTPNKEVVEVSTQ